MENISKKIREIQEAERKNVGSARCKYAETNYKLIEPILKLVTRQGEHKTFSDNIHMDLVIEHCYNYGSIYETYVIMYVSAYGFDRVYEPLIRFVVDNARKMVIPVYYENSTMQFYMHIFGDDYSKCNTSTLKFADSALHNIINSALFAYDTCMRKNSPESASDTIDNKKSEITPLVFCELQGLNRAEDIKYVQNNHLETFYEWLPDCGHSIYAVPLSELPSAEKNGDLSMYLCPFPLDYVKEKGFSRVGEYIVCDGEYDHKYGLLIDEKYIRYD